MITRLYDIFCVYLSCALLTVLFTFSLLISIIPSSFIQPSSRRRMGLNMKVILYLIVLPCFYTHRNKTSAQQCPKIKILHHLKCLGH
jgi:hypothetical protein